MTDNLTPAKAHAAARRARLADQAFYMLPSALAALAEVSRVEDWGLPQSSAAGTEGLIGPDGVAVVPVRGSLENRQEDVGWWGGGTSYEALRACVDACVADASCKAIVLDIDSPGGIVSGCMETAVYLRAKAAEKPIVAFVDGMACSGAYALASGAAEIVCAPSATLGSIGVVMLHMDYSGMLDNFGMKPTLIYAGKYKVDGSPMRPLAPQAEKRLQDMTDDHYEHFVRTVGAHRPDLGVAGARRTEAGLFVGKRAVVGGLADLVGSAEDARRMALGRVTAGELAAGEAKPAGARQARVRAYLTPAARMTTESDAMAVKVYKAGEAHANSLIDAGKVDRDASWSFSAEDGDKLLGANGDDWDNYARFHLAEDDEEGEKTKARYKYPFGKDGKVFRSGVVAAKSRAGGEKADEVEAAAGRLLAKIDDKDTQEKEAKMADEKALAAARGEGASAERARCAAILNAPEAEGRLEAAKAFAFDSEMAAEAVVKALGKMPAAVAATTSRLDLLQPRAGVRGDGGAAAEPANDYERGVAAFGALKAAKK